MPGTALLLESEQLVARLQSMLDEVQQKADEEARRHVLVSTPAAIEMLRKAA